MTMTILWLASPFIDLFQAAGKEGRHVQDVDHTSLVEKAAQVLGEILSGGRYEFTDDYTVKKSKKKAGKRQRMI